METNYKKLKQYFLEQLSAQEVEEIELQLISNAEFANNLETAETELLEDYLEHSLKTEEKKLFETKYLITEERRKKMEFLRTLKDYAKKTTSIIELSETPPTFFERVKSMFAPRGWALGFGSLALIVTIGVSSYFVWKNYSSSRSEVLISLNKAYKTERPLDSRITDFDYAPAKNTRGANDADKIDKLELENAKLLANRAVRENPSAENLHTLGRVYLAEKNFDEAIKQFEKAVKLSPNNAKLRNDLGATLLEKGKPLNEGKLENLAKANEEFTKAIELDQSLLDSYFNKAICIQELNLPNQAKEAWEEYLKLDSKSQWAEEARKRLQELENNKPVSKTKEEILKEFFAAKEANDKEKAWQIVSKNREMITGKLIPQQLTFLFVESKVNGDEVTAKNALDALVYVGKIEEEKSGDLFWRDLATFYQKVTPEKIAQLKQAKDAYLEGLKNSNTDNEKALTAFSASADYYSQSGNNAEQLIARFWKGYSLIRLYKFEEGDTEFEKLGVIAIQNSYKWLALTVQGWLAAKDDVAKNISKSISLSKSLLAQANEISDLYNQQRVSSQLANIYLQAGQFEKTADFIQKSLKFGDHPDSSLRQKWRDYHLSSKLFYDLRFFETSLAFEREALNLAANNLEETTFNYTSLIQLGLIYGTTGNYQKSLEYFAESQKISENMTDQKTKEVNFAFTNLHLGQIKRIAKNYAEAIENYDRAISFYSQGKGVETNLYNARKGRLFCYLALKKDDLYQKEFPLILELFNKYRSRILEEQNRNSFFSNEQDIYDIAVDYEFGKANYDTAFDYLEESRSRSLLDLQNSVAKVATEENLPEIKLPSNIAEPIKLSQIQTEMPDDVQLLVYAVESEKVLIWAISKNSLNTSKFDITAESLQEKVTNYLESISKSSDANEHLDLSKELNQILISPIKDKLERNKQLFIIPDKILFRLPFATLYSDKYLVEDYKISYSPSANVFLNCTRKAKEFSKTDAERLLSIGNPNFNQSEYEGNLKPLSSAKTEAKEIAKNYLNPKILTETDATKENVKVSLKDADIIHFAGHYIVEPKLPLLSSLVLAGNKKEDSNLANYEIMGEGLSHTRLIVLSACDTEIEKIYKGEGLIGASRTFLASKVPLVVASQWAVDSEATKELMIRFHQLRQSKEISTAESLRQAQLEMLKSEKFKHPYYWAAFASIGGYTRF